MPQVQITPVYRFFPMIVQPISHVGEEADLIAMACQKMTELSAQGKLGPFFHSGRYLVVAELVSFIGMQIEPTIVPAAFALGPGAAPGPGNGPGRR